MPLACVLYPEPEGRHLPRALSAPHMGGLLHWGFFHGSLLVFYGECLSLSNKQFSPISPMSPLVATSKGCDAQLTKETEAKHTGSVQSVQHRINAYKNSSHFN